MVGAPRTLKEKFRPFHAVTAQYLYLYILGCSTWGIEPALPGPEIGVSYNAIY